MERDRPDAAAIARAADCLRLGGLVAFPTETVYGLGVHALDSAAVRRLFTAKDRPANDPLIVHVDAIDRIHDLVLRVPDTAVALASRFWPGPLTLVLPRSARVPDEVTAGLNTVAVRVPAHPVARALLTAASIPVAAPSANLFSRPSPTRASHVLEDLDGRIDLVLDGGATEVGVESTVLDLSGSVPMILRPGAISLAMLQEILPRVEQRSSSESGRRAMPSPGMLERHYSPRAPLTVYDGEPGDAVARVIQDARAATATGAHVGIMAADEDRVALADIAGSRVTIAYLGSRDDLATVASRLYASMRELDSSGVDRIFVTAFPGDEGLAVAIQDRLRRAAV